MHLCGKGFKKYPLPNSWSTHLTCVSNKTNIMHTNWYVSDPIHEGGLRIEIHVLVKIKQIQGSKDVSVCINSEYTTVYLSRSKICDCGEQRYIFLITMKTLNILVLVYINGHGAQGSGSANKNQSYDLTYK